MFLTINKSCIYFINHSNTINDYYQYIVSLFIIFLENNTDININININFSSENYTFPNDNRTIRINFNYEHTLVKINGRGAKGSPVGTIETDENTNYLVRIERYNELNHSDIIIDYSNPNIYNIVESKLSSELVKYCDA